jgi:hypothetical protein
LFSRPTTHSFLEVIMEMLEAFFSQYPGLTLSLILASALLYASISLWCWYRRSKTSEKEVATTPDWVKNLPPVYTAGNVLKNCDHWIWCPETKQKQRFRVLKIGDGWFYVKLEEAHGSGVHEGWALEIPSNTRLHPGHLLPSVPKTPMPA